MPKSSIVHEPALCRDTLTIKKIICYASGAPWPPPADELWDGIQADLKDACSQGELTFSKNHSDQPRRFYSIRLLDLWSFLVKKDQRWKPLRDFCHRWESARGITLSPEYDEQAGGLASPLAPSPEVKSPPAPEPPPKKRGGGPKHGRYFGPLKRHLKGRKDLRDDLDTASLVDLRNDARSRLITDGVEDIPKSRSAFNAAILDILRTLGVNR